MVKNRPRPRLAVPALLFALVLLATAGVWQVRAAPAAKDTLIIGTSSELTTLDQGAGSIPEITVGENIFETLANRKLDGTVEPNLATRWEVSPDARTWTFYLRKGVKFHNGEPFNAEAVKFSVEWIRDPKVFTQFKGYWSLLDRVDLVDDSTVRFYFTKSYPLLAQVLPWHLPILPPKYVSENRTSWGRKPIGTGPYKFVEWVPNVRIVMEANMDYWGGPPPFKKLIFRPIPEETARTAALLSGEVDIVGPLNLDQAAMVAATKGVRVEWTDTLARERIQIRWDKKPFDDIRVRQAIAHAINRDPIIKSILGGRAVPVYGPVVKLEWGFDPNLKDPYPYNPARARQLLAEAGYPNGLEADYAYVPGMTAKNAEAAQAIASDLAAVGIKLNLTPTEWGKFVKMQKEHQAAPLSQTFWKGGGNFHGWHPFQILLHCKVSSALWNPKTPQPYWCDPKVDALHEEATQVLVTDPARARQLWAQAQELAAKLVHQLWLWQYKEPWGASDKIVFKPAPSSDIRVFHQARPAR